MLPIHNILDKAVFASLDCWKLPANPNLHLLNVSENYTYVVEAGDFKAALRVHRPEYNSEIEIRSELDWLGSLRQSKTVLTPKVIRGTDGRRIQKLAGGDGFHSRHMVMFEFVAGQPPDEKENLYAIFEQLGEISAHLHHHSRNWKQPKSFMRPHWDLDTIFGPLARWGSWRDAPFVTSDIRQVLCRLEAVLTERLNSFGTDSRRFGLIHADMRLANLMVNPNGETWVIDFDDCGFGWFMYDFAAAVSFIEDDERVPIFKECWIKGYERQQKIPLSARQEMDTMMMLRRMALLAWVGSRIESTEPQKLAPTFAATTARLAESYLTRQNSF